MDAWCTLGGGIASHGYSADDDGFAMGGLPRFSAQPACGAAGNKLQQLVSDSATHNHECTRIVQMRHDGMKKIDVQRVRVPEAPSTRHGGRARASRDSCHAADDDKNRVATAALGRDAPPKQKWEPPS